MFSFKIYLVSTKDVSDFAALHTTPKNSDLEWQKPFIYLSESMAQQGGSSGLDQACWYLPVHLPSAGGLASS